MNKATTPAAILSRLHSNQALVWGPKLPPKSLALFVILVLASACIVFMDISVIVRSWESPGSTDSSATTCNCNSEANPLRLNVGKSMSERSVRLPHPSKPSLPGKVKNTRRYSRFRCLGDDNKINGFTERICVFENICYSKDTNQFLFYRRPNVPPRTVLFDADVGERFNFTDNSHGFVALLQDIDLLGLHMYNHWAPVVVAGESPAAKESERVSIQSNLHVLFHHQFDTSSIRTFLWEELAGIYYAMVRMNLYVDNVVPLHGINLPLPDGDEFKKYREAFYPAVTKRQPVTLVGYHHEISRSSRKAISHVCFDQMLVGGTMPRFLHRASWHNHGHEPMFMTLRAKIFRRFGLSPTRLPKSHKVVIIDSSAIQKEFQVNIFNLEAVTKAIRQRYPMVKISVIKLEKLAVKEQLLLMQETTVLITPAGPASMILPFLPEGAHAITMDYPEHNPLAPYGTSAGQSVSLDAPFWNNWPHVKMHYYQVFSVDDVHSGRSLIMNPAKHVREGTSPVSVIVDVKRMLNLVDAAFEEMDP